MAVVSNTSNAVGMNNEMRAANVQQFAKVRGYELVEISGDMAFMLYGRNGPILNGLTPIYVSYMGIIGVNVNPAPAQKILPFEVEFGSLHHGTILKNVESAIMMFAVDAMYVRQGGPLGLPKRQQCIHASLVYSASEVDDLTLISKPEEPFPYRATLFAWLQKYGRHLPSCSTGMACQCGFEEILKQCL